MVVYYRATADRPLLTKKKKKAKNITKQREDEVFEVNFGGTQTLPHSCIISYFSLQALT